MDNYFERYDRLALFEGDDNVSEVFQRADAAIYKDKEALKS